MPRSEQIKESRRQAWEWADSFKIGEMVEVKVGIDWEPIRIREISRTGGWPFIEGYSESRKCYLGVYYRGRKLVRKETKVIAKLPTERSLEQLYECLSKLEAWVRKELEIIEPIPLHKAFFSPYLEGKRDVLSAVLRRVQEGG